MASPPRVSRKKRTSGKKRTGKLAPLRTPSDKRVSKKAAKLSSAKRVVSPPEANVVEAALAAFAHEVRTPLTGILAISSLLATSSLNERERRWVETIKTGAEHLAALATLFVDAARRGESGLRAREDFFDLRTLAQAAGDSLAGRAAAKGLQSDVVIAENLPAFAIGDPVRLRAALENLIDNAVKFTNTGEVTLKVTLQKAAAGKINVGFEVGDSGIGLSLAEMRKLFRPFSQANISIASRFGGAGLGLSSVKQLARAMGGDVSVAQRTGGGTLFTLKVALKQAGDSSETLDGNGAVDSFGTGTRSLKLLSVEDNPFGRVVLNAILTELGHTTQFIERGEAAPERIKQGQFDAVLMDMVLPGIGGVEAIKLIRGLDAPYGQVAIIGVSGRADDEQRSKAAGADAFLVKPVSPRALAMALREATRRAVT